MLAADVAGFVQALAERGKSVAESFGRLTAEPVLHGQLRRFAVRMVVLSTPGPPVITLRSGPF
jgi:hypothetical protein